MRLFIAIRIPKDVSAQLAQYRDKLTQPGIKPVKYFHLTLKFVGEAEPAPILEKLKTISFEPFQATLGQIGAFPKFSCMRVIWIGLTPENKLIELQESVDNALFPLFPKERHFSPHITLARVKYADKVYEEKVKSTRVEPSSFPVDNIELIKSTLTPDGPIYEKIS